MAGKIGVYWRIENGLNGRIEEFKHEGGLNADELKALLEKWAHFWGDPDYEDIETILGLLKDWEDDIAVVKFHREYRQDYDEFSHWDVHVVLRPPVKMLDELFKAFEGNENSTTVTEDGLIEVRFY